MTTSQSRWNFSPDTTSALLMAEAHARELRHSEVGTVHILAGIVCEQTGAGGKILRKAGLTVELANAALGAAQGLGPIQTAKLPYDSEAERLLEMASDTAVADPDTFSSAINTAHLVAAMLNSLCRGREVLFRLAGTRLGEIQAGIAGELPYLPQPILAAAGKQPSPQRNMAKGTQNNQALPDYLSDLTADAEAGRLDPVVGRDDEIKRLIQILCRRTKNNPVLIGEPGVGKTAIAEGLARRIVAGDVPEELRGRRVLGLSIGGLIGGSMYRGEFEQRIKGLLKMLEDKSSILLIDEVHTLVGAGAAEGGLDASNILKPALARGEIQVIGATTLDEYRKHIEQDAALERRFQPVMVGEPSWS